MTWKKDKPKIEGYYWVRAKGQPSRDYIHPVKVYRSNRQKKSPDMIFSDGENFSIESDIFIEWWDEQIILFKEEILTDYILHNWDREKVINFAKNLLGKECLNKFHCPHI